MAEVSIIVPVFNVENYIAECIESIQKQTFKDFEVLVVDDCGQDRSIEIVEKYAKKDPRIKIIKHEKNKGLGTARNTALDASTGKYIFCVDSDDWIMETYIEKIYNKLEESNLNSVWVKPYTYWQNEGRMSETFYFPQLANHPGGFINLKPDIIGNFPAYAWNKAYRASFLKENNVRWADGLMYEDIYFYYQFFTKSPKIYLLNELLYVYRRRDGSIISDCVAGTRRIEDIFDVTYLIYNYMKDNNLFPKYEKSFYRLMADNINLFRHFDTCHERVIKAGNELLDKMGYPECFEKTN